ncbi:MAG: transketolase, partial [Mycoplasmataceae bacterium]|nr:transketolase [Mycoplasmataceae bacterium]
SINRAEGGHTGMAIGAAPITHSIIGKVLNFSNKDSKWINRDRFILSAGHGSMSYYSIMHFMGLLSKEDMKNHKVLGSKTPSHPEIDMFEYVDATTGPLGQGIAMGIGMAISQRYLATKYNKPNFDVYNHDVFVLHGDGCIQEGVALEAIQIAGTMKLDKLIMIHDYNDVQIDTRASEVNNIDFQAYFTSLGFSTFEVKDNTPENIELAIASARKSDKPSYIQVHSIIAKDTPNENISAGHNGAFSEEVTLEFKAKIGLDNKVPFEYDQDVYEQANSYWEDKNKNFDEWTTMFEEYSSQHPTEVTELLNLKEKKYSFDLSSVEFKEEGVATRNYFVPIMNALESHNDIVTLAADLKGATKIGFKEKMKDGGKHIPLGIREFAMQAIANGMSLHSNLKVMDSTFLAFADYEKPALRLGAIMELPTISVFTHDTYQVGGDGPTHEPVDQLPMLRSIPNVKVIRPADAFEVRMAFQYALESKDEKVAIIGCRQPIKSFNMLNEIKAAYIVKAANDFDVSLLASGSEVELAYNISVKLEEDGIKAQVVSVPVLQDLITNDELAKELKLDTKPMYAIEASSDSMWFRLSKHNKFDAFLAEGFGHSAPGDVVYAVKGFTVENIIPKVKKLIK